MARDAVFLQHLKDALSLKLLTLNQLDLTPSDDLDTCDSLEMYSEAVLMSRLIAKFLGYLHFCPYYGDEKITPVLDEQYRSLRLSAGFIGLNIMQLLDEGHRSGRLHVVLPWLTQYLSRIDSFSLTLPPYKDVLLLLYGYLESLKTSLAKSSCTYSDLIQYVCLQWMFSLTELEDLELSCDDSLKFLHNTENQSDKLDLATVNTVYECSATLQACKGILVEYVMGTKSKFIASRKITPLSSVSPSIPTPSSSQSGLSLQQQLEDNFFQNQSASLKKSVTFTAERVSSSYIKEFRSGHLNTTLIKSKIKAREIGKQTADKANQDMNLLRVQLLPVFDKLAASVVTELHSTALSGVESYSQQRISAIITNLLPSGTEKHIVGVVNSIALRSSTDRVRKWLTTYVTTQFMSSELMQEAVKYVRSHCNSTPSGKLPEEVFVNLGCTKHNPNSPSPFDTMLKLHSVFQKVYNMEASGELVETQVEDLSEVLVLVHSCLTERCDIIHSALTTILYLLVSIIVICAKTLGRKFSTKLIDMCDFLWTSEHLSSFTSNLVELVPESDLCCDSECDTFHYRLMAFLASTKL